MERSNKKYNLWIEHSTERDRDPKVGMRMIEPVNGPISSPFGKIRSGRPHLGVDYGVPVGTPVYAVDAGTVIRAAENPGNYGNLIIISHGVVDGQHRYSLYGHLSQFDVKYGDQVARGQQIGESGGRKGAPGAGRSTGPHLHFELIEVDANSYRNGLPWSKGPGPTNVKGNLGRLDPYSRIGPNPAPKPAPPDVSGPWSGMTGLGPPVIEITQNGDRIKGAHTIPQTCECLNYAGRPGESHTTTDYFEGTIQGDMIVGWYLVCKVIDGYLDENWHWVKCKAKWVKKPLRLKLSENGKTLYNKDGTPAFHRPSQFDPFTPPAGGSISRP